MKEIYKVKLPKKIIFGDPLYFETMSGLELNRLTADITVPKKLTEARVVIEIEPDSLYPEYNNIQMSIILSPKEFLDTYLDNKVFKYQTQVEKAIGVDTAQYYLAIDDKDDFIKTGADGMWGSILTIKNGRKIEGILMTIAFPDEYENINMLRKAVNYFFKDVQKIDINANTQEEHFSNINGKEPKLL
jgi:hypothetical protein